MRNGLKGVNGAARGESPKAPRTKEAARQRGRGAGHCGQKASRRHPDEFRNGARRQARLRQTAAVTQPRGAHHTHKRAMRLYFNGIIIAACSFLIIGVFHPVVIKTEYHTGTKYWWVFLLLGAACLTAALLTADTMASALLGVLGASFLWSIHELFEQRERVRKGWFPRKTQGGHARETTAADKHGERAPSSAPHAQGDNPHEPHEPRGRARAADKEDLP